VSAEPVSKSCRPFHSLEGPLAGSTLRSIWHCSRLAGKREWRSGHPGESLGEGTGRAQRIPPPGNFARQAPAIRRMVSEARGPVLSRCSEHPEFTTR
jgi:hypothetical protein